MSNFTSYSLNSSGTTKKAAVIHSMTAEGNILCSGKVADGSRGAFSNAEVTCKRCLNKLNPKSKAEKASKPKAEGKRKSASKKAEVRDLATRRTELALELLKVPKDQRRQPEFVAKRAELVDLREQLQALGYEATTYQANAKILAGITFLAPKKRGRKSKAK